MYIITFAGTTQPACATIFTDIESALHEIDAAEPVLKAPLDLLIVGAQPSWAISSLFRRPARCLT